MIIISLNSLKCLYAFINVHKYLNTETHTHAYTLLTFMSVFITGMQLNYYVFVILNKRRHQNVSKTWI